MITTHYFRGGALPLQQWAATTTCLLLPFEGASFSSSSSKPSSINVPFYGSPLPPSSRYRHTGDSTSPPTPHHHHHHHHHHNPPLSPLQRLATLVHSSIVAMHDPTRHDAVAAVGEVTGSHALSRMLSGMERDPVGRRILRDRPIVDGRTAALASSYHHRARAAAPSSDATATATAAGGGGGSSNNTFGVAYSSFLAMHAFDPECRASVRYLADPDLAYVMTRYRQCHDYWHVLTGLPPTVLGELGLKLLELVQTGMPLAALSAMSSMISSSSSSSSGLILGEVEREVLWGTYLPWAIRANGNMAEHALMCVYYEEEFGTDVDDLRTRMGIEVAPKIELS